MFLVVYYNFYIFFRSIDHEAHTFVVHYDTYNSDATLSITEVLPLGEWKTTISRKTLLTTLTGKPRRIILWFIIELFTIFFLANEVPGYLLANEILFASDCRNNMKISNCQVYSTYSTWNTFGKIVSFASHVTKPVEYLTFFRELIPVLYPRDMIVNFFLWKKGVVEFLSYVKFVELCVVLWISKLIVDFIICTSQTKVILRICQTVIFQVCLVTMRRLMKIRLLWCSWLANCQGVLFVLQSGSNTQK